MVEKLNEYGDGYAVSGIIRLVNFRKVVGFRKESPEDAWPFLFTKL